MPVEIDVTNLPPVPKRLPEILRTIREQLGLAPDEIVPKVGRIGEELLAYENDEEDLLVPVYGITQTSAEALETMFQRQASVTLENCKYLNCTSIEDR